MYSSIIQLWLKREDAPMCVSFEQGATNVDQFHLQFGQGNFEMVIENLSLEDIKKLGDYFHQVAREASKAVK